MEDIIVFTTFQYTWQHRSTENISDRVEFKAKKKIDGLIENIYKNRKEFLIS